MEAEVDKMNQGLHYWPLNPSRATRLGGFRGAHQWCEVITDNPGSLSRMRADAVRRYEDIDTGRRFEC